MKTLPKLISFANGTYGDSLLNYPITGGAMLLMNVLRRLASPNKSFFVSEIRIVRAAVGTAVNAFSVNNTTGEVWSGDVKVVTFDPAVYSCIWSFDAAVTLYTVAQSTPKYEGLNAPLPGTTTITASAIGTAYGEINPARTAISAYVAGANTGLWLGFFEK